MKIIGLVIAAIVGLVAYVIRLQNLERVEQMDADGACLSCASLDVEIRGDRAHCLACGFEFGADRGGALTARDIEGLKGDGR